MISVGENMSIVILRNFPNICEKPEFYILEKPLLKTTKSEIDIHGGTLSMEMDWDVFELDSKAKLHVEL